MKTPRTPILVAAILMASCAQITRAQTWTSINVPGPYWTEAFGISGGNIVGMYFNPSNPGPNDQGFRYDGSTFTTIDDPLGTLGTDALGINSSGKIVGDYYAGSSIPQGFSYNGTNYVTIAPSGGINGTICDGIANNGIIVGTYTDSNYVNHGFIYNGTSYTTLNDPNADPSANRGTYARAISNTNGNIVGLYLDSTGKQHGFVYNGTSYATLDYPGSQFTDAFGIDGNNIVGSYLGADSNIHGFVYNGSTWTTLDFPGPETTIIEGIQGNNLVGQYTADDGTIHGFLATVPEPSSIVLISIGLGVLIVRSRTTRKKRDCVNRQWRFDLCDLAGTDQGREHNLIGNRILCETNNFEIPMNHEKLPGDKWHLPNVKRHLRRRSPKRLEAPVA